MLIDIFFSLQDYDGFFESKESNTVFSFLGLKPSMASKVTIILQTFMKFHLQTLAWIFFEKNGNFSTHMLTFIFVSFLVNLALTS